MLKTTPQLLLLFSMLLAFSTVFAPNQSAPAPTQSVSCYCCVFLRCLYACGCDKRRENKVNGNVGSLSKMVVPALQLVPSLVAEQLHQLRRVDDVGEHEGLGEASRG